jgi:cysteine desulfurase
LLAIYLILRAELPVGFWVIYLDNNATTRPSAVVIAAVESALKECWHNPSSVHRAGQGARQKVELARRDVAALIGVPAREVTFTSGGTEAIDVAIRGVLAAAARRVVVSTKVEHAAVRDLLEDLEKVEKMEVRYAPIDREGVVVLDALPGLIYGAGLASIQWANNETGAIQPVREIAALCRSRGVVFHCDGTQWVGKEEVAKERSDEVTKLKSDASSASSLRHSVTPSLPPCDLLTFSPHKFHGPKGVGVLWARSGVAVRPVIHGTQELGRRGGTENVPGILGAGASCREAAAWLAQPEERRRLAALRDRFEGEMLAGCPGSSVNGPRDASRRLWNTTNIGFPKLEAEALLLLLSEKGVCASAGAACSSGSLDPSPVLLAMGVPPEIAHGSLRFSLSKETTEEEVDEAARIVVESVKRLAESMPGGRA